VRILRWRVLKSRHPVNLKRFLIHTIQACTLRRVSAVACALPLLAYLTFSTAVAWWPYPDGIDAPPANGTFIEDRNGIPLAALVAYDAQWRLPLTYEQISPHLLHAIVAVEDCRFFEHAGVDWKSAFGAIGQDVRHWGIRRGASTLTMQLERLRDPRPRTFFNKLEQAVRAKQSEKHSTKEAILVEYLNRAPFGGNLVGAGAASWRYFGRPCRDLSLAEAALLAGLPQSPNRLRPDRHADVAMARRNHVLNRMLCHGMIDTKQFAEAIAEPIAAKWHPLPQDADPDAMPTYDTIAVQFAGKTVRTTLDLEIQRRATLLLREQIQSLHVSGVTAGAVVVLDTPTGECLTAISHQANESQRVRRGVDLTRRPRSTGSTLKPFIYAAAFDAGICSPKTILLDAPAAWPGYSPGNYDRMFRGPIPAADALAESRNIPALVLLGKIGVERSIGVLESFGFNTIAHQRHRYGLSLAIGGAEATPLELAEAYATLGRGGIWRKVSMIRNEAATERRVMRAGPCRQAIAAISATPRTSAISPEAASLEVAWKTGTSSGHRDAWCAAVTPRRTVVIWLGNPAGEGAASLVGVEAAAPLALRLIASLDDRNGSEIASGFSDDRGATDRGTPRPVLAEWLEDTGLGVPRPVAPGISSPVIISPQPDQQIILNPDLPADRQLLLLEASTDNAGVWWFVDGSPVGRERRAWWTPTPGPHRIRIVNGDGRSAEAAVHVQSPETASR